MNKRYVLLELTLEKHVDQEYLESMCAQRCHSVERVMNCEQVKTKGFGFVVEGPLPDGRQLTNVVIPEEVAQSAPEVFPWSHHFEKVHAQVR